MLWYLLWLQKAPRQLAEKDLFSHVIRDASVSHPPHRCFLSYNGCVTDMWAPNSTLLLRPYIRSQHFGHRMWWTMCHRLWGPQERGPQALSLRIALFCSSALWPNPSPAVRVMKEKIPWEQARGGMNCSGRADLDLNTE